MYLDITVHRLIVRRDGNQVLNTRDRRVTFLGYKEDDGLGDIGV